MTEKLVIINGDDFGYSPGIKEGIAVAYIEGVLTSTSAMANLLTGEESLVDLKARLTKPPLGIGVHLNLTYGKPLRGDLFGNQEFTRPMRGQDPAREWSNSAWAEYFRQYEAEDISKEYRAQILRAQQVLGVLDHIDSHHGSDYYVGDVFLNVAREFNLAARPSSPLSEISIEGGDFQNDPTFFDRAKRMGVRTVTRPVMDYFYRYDNPQQAFYASLASIKPGELVEYMFHPSIDNQNGDWRMKDLEILTDPHTAQRIKELDITLTTYSTASIPA
ncbi:ChbG/HpnK family deacetylase [Candidatus Daviesbacteria bacterium]|nr:ChbG/HpnK family deacetylase [Candidatus Daviesbacteria bacterium]